ncbi:LamG-like jellyroll fold domain-containing protein [Hephaestia sp. GCM10023244]|uniref:glycosyl hydrolase 2 galactose-binding domain-containing protein n=1 Tax=unclassified Hephaestia TaxID=2631281 RepID=UPI00207793BF|nr:LamG-like jellyroll fold domain-containing protein [Hephaestia sp. MAHUQ-44]MCM8730598.1 glycoside hydrolase family 2 [Hephaestia sp. MAHUQ-44]
MRHFRWMMLVGAAAIAAPGHAQIPDNGGPYNAHFMPGGIGIDRDLGDGAVAGAGHPFSLSTWIRPDARQPGRVTLIALGDPAGACRCLELRDGRPAFDALVARTALAPGAWAHVALVSDGETATLYVDGKRVARGAVAGAAVAPKIGIGPVVAGQVHFGGTLLGATLDTVAMRSDQVAAAAASKPDVETAHILQVGVGWAFQKIAWIGLTEQQDPWTLPHAKAPVAAPVAKPLPDLPALARIADDRWQINGWTLAAAPDVTADGAALSRPDFNDSTWYAATVPGTVLTTLVDRGVYPNPYYGLDNMAIPERLARQDYWYRARFTVPAEAAGKALTLVFNGINFASDIWLNGKHLGGTKGAFMRGQFAIAPVAGENVIAVKVSPPPHPGIPHEQSIKGGPGYNGGQLAIDGPTFIATEGWDWMPGIRDRNTGIWLPVDLQAHGSVRIGDPHVVTDLPLPKTDSADIYITVPVTNAGTQPAAVTVRAAFDGVTVAKTVQAAPGTSEVRLTPAEFAQLRVRNPALWWPNGYGDPVLHDLALSVSADGAVSDTRQLRFGIREISYDLSLFDSKGALRRVTVQPTNGALVGEKLIDVRHEAIKQSPRGWAESLTLAGETSPAVTPCAETLPEPHLTLRVNGVKIATRGGNWGMDDAMKRVSRDRLGPYFRLQREAHMNVIRNWMGNNDEQQFFDLADENGLMVFNDFWQSTQNSQIEPDDPQLFLANARDVISRYRNHPSIVLWFGRNEGVPYPTLNEGLDDLVFQLDGTRWYTGSSNTVNLQGSGPYNYRPPVGYFTDLATGFSVETGTPSLSTLESIRAWVPEADRWPLSDTLAYHDWHFGGNGDTKSFMEALGTMFGPATSLADFERKAQMMNLETHKAMYEGFLGHLWTKNSGRLLWMTHPAWPSNAWQLYSWDYDTSAAYYGAKSAAEPIHIQLNLPGNDLVVLNTTRADRKGLTATTTVVGLDNEALFTRTDTVDALANRATALAPVPLDAILATTGMALVRLDLRDGATPVSRNFYWRGRDQAAYRALDGLAQTPLALTAAPPVRDGEDMLVRVTLSNRSDVPALEAKLTLVDAAGQRILPAYYSDNYVSLLPDETRIVEIRYPASVTSAPLLNLRGWNVIEQKAATR